MQYLVYFIVLVISAGSVLFGVEWMQAPMSPMPTSAYELRAAKPPAPPAVQQAAAKPAETAGKAEPAEPTAAPPAPAPVAAAPQPAPLVAPEPQPAIAEAPPVPLCDIQACERAYRSFTVSDCTYQPNDGPRRLCTRGTPPVAASTPKPDIRAQATCNIAACTDAYISFNAADCTYQPLEGPRRMCEK